MPPQKNKREYVVPFGRYEGLGAAAPPNNELLIGRRAQRAQLLNLLFTQGRRGAYLVTGHRGSGKTSFVDHCINAYRDDVFGRFLRSDVGRVWLWDRLILLAALAAVIAGLLVLRGVLHFVLHLWPTAPHPWLAWVVATPITLVLAYPIVVGWGFLGTFAEVCNNDRPKALALVSCVSIATILFGMLEGSRLGASFLFVPLVLSFVAFCWPEKKNHDGKPDKLVSAAWILPLKASVFLAIGIHLVGPALALIPALPNLREYSRSLLLEDATKSLLLEDATAEYQRNSELAWWALAVILILLVSRIEYNRILKPFRRASANVQLESAENQDSPNDRHFKLLIETTLFSFVYRLWLPVLDVSINLGVETLDHRRVIEAMLMGLRSAYMREFIGWRSPLANILRVARLAALVFATTLVGDHVIGSMGEDPPIFVELEQTQPSVVAFLRVNLLAHPPQGGAPPLKTNDTYGERAHLSDFVLPTALREAQAGEKISRQHQIEIRIYHVLIFVLLWLLSRLIARRWPILPYQETKRRLDRFIDSLSSKLSEETTTKLDIEKIHEFLGTSVESKASKETDPLDPRTVELAFLDLLRDIQESTHRLPFSRTMALSLPAPEVIFVFDELDKVGVHVAEPSADIAALAVIGWDEERERSRALHALLANMKNILSSAPARFFFVGGRNLHDEWLADQTDRQPLLTRLFNDEVHVPSLLTDETVLTNPTSQEPIARGTWAYLMVQLQRANNLYTEWQTVRENEWLGIRWKERQKATFVASLPDKLSIPIYRSDGQRLYSAQTPSDFVNHFVEFLTYRSMGNVKRLAELVEGFILPTEQVPRETRTKWQGALTRCEHLLYFSDADRHRIELIADVYRGLYRAFEGSAVWKDDKLAPGVFYLADFLLKFHRRAFTQNNMERVDELVHIHRAPDLRPVLHDIVATWAGPVLHPIRNGMYAYRFRSDFAAELMVASRSSEEELAAFNFTLDESQSLKDIYKRRLQCSDKTTAYEYEAALGELHEFDEEYELARYHYRNAIHALDKEMQSDLGSSEEGTTDPRAMTGPRGQSQWGVSRLRLMLQLGMTHERAKDFESAMVVYCQAGHLARTLLMRLLPQQSEDAANISLSKHLDLLFQPIFAQAWVAEKSGSGPDTGAGLIETELMHIRQTLPFVNLPFGKRAPAKSPTDLRHANFALTMAELHDKAGDFFFTKGKQTKQRDGEFDPAPGYLARAHYHYAVALHEIRSFSKYRRESSAEKFGAGKQTVETLGWPDFNLQVAAGALCDLGEALLAGVSMDAVAQSHSGPGDSACDWITAEKQVQDLVNGIIDWLDNAEEKKESSEWGEPLKNFLRIQRAPDLQDWIGKPCESDSTKLIHLEPTEEARTRLVISLLLCLAGASLLARDGRIEDAMREALQVADTIGRVMFWRAIWHDFKKIPKYWNGAEAHFWAHLWFIGWYALERAAARYRRVDNEANAEWKNDSPYVGTLVNRAKQRAAWVLRLAADRTFTEAKVSVGDAAFQRLERWGLENADDAIDRLKRSIETDSYPMFHRLRCLQISIEYSVIQNKNFRREDLDELRTLEREYRMALQFTPFDIGITLALAALDEVDSHYDDKAKLRNDAFDLLKTSQQLFTMRQGYYDAISDLHYLYDDFNDRRVHHNLAIQMAGADVTSYLLNRAKPVRKI